MADSKRWEAAYAAYKAGKPVRSSGTSQNKRIKVKKLVTVRENHRKVTRSADEHWVTIHREFLRWKKTDDYDKWRRRQFGKQDGKCYYCDCELRGKRTNVEHVLAIINGGTNKKANLVLSCWECNKNKYVSVLGKKKVKALKEKHNSKKLAYQAEIELGYQLREMLKED